MELAKVRRAMAAVGAASLLAQVVLLRELLAFSQGNELVLGGVLAIWLCLSAAFAVAGARVGWQPARAASGLASLLGLAPLLFLMALRLTALARPEALGEAPALQRIVATTIAALLPACSLGGLAFAWAAKAAGRANPIYVAETAGAAVAGLVFHFLLGERFHGAWIVLLAGLGCACAGVATGAAGRRWKSIWLPLSTSLAAVALAPSFAAAVDGAHFPSERVLSLRPSRYGQLAVLARGEQRIFAQDGVLLFTTEDQIAAEESVHLPMLLHPAPRRVLFLGGGLGGGLVEMLKHGPERIDYAEVDPGLLALAAEHAGAEVRAALLDPRVHAMADDGRRILRQAKGQYDLILIDAPVPQNALGARYASRECFDDARRALAPDGILALVTPGSDVHLDAAARRRHGAMLASLGKAFAFVGVAPGAETIMWAAGRPVDARAAVLAERLRQRGLALVQVGPAWLADRLFPMNLDNYRRALADVPPAESRDFRPLVYLYGLLGTLARLSPATAKQAIGALSAPVVAGLAAGAFALALLLSLIRRRRVAPGLAAATAGAAGMSMQMVLLIAYQSLRGHLYHALGLMLAGSMAGMAVGAQLATRLLRRERGLALGLAATASIAVLAAGVLALAHAAPELVADAILPLLSLVGMATGAVYPLAVQASLPEQAAARVYAWDLLGAAAAASFTSLLAIPLLGLVPVALLCAGLCSVAMAANLGRRSSPAPG